MVNEEDSFYSSAKNQNERKDSGTNKSITLDFKQGFKVTDNYIDTLSVKSSSKKASGNMTGRASGSSDIKDTLYQNLGPKG